MKKIAIYGDSHSRLFEVNTLITNLIPDLRNYSIKVKAIDGASCVGFGKRQSTLNVKNMILNDISVNRIDFLVLNFGQVDTELGLFYEKYVKKKTINITECINRYIKAYVEFISNIPMDKSKIIVKGVNVTALCYSQHRFLNYIIRIITENINDEADKIEIRKKMKQDLDVFTDSLRTNIALKFNDSLKLALSKINVSYIDINAGLLDPLTNLIKLEFIYGKFDHHIVDSIMSRSLYLNELLNVLTVKAITHESYE
jgi:hypothetical protein